MVKKVPLMLLLIFLLFAISGCTNNSGLVSGAQKTYQDYIDALNQGKETSQPDIPISYWSTEIRNLSPLRVYLDRSNIVIVKNQTATSESGLYINLPFSSYIPNKEDQKFKFTKVDEHVYDFISSLP